ncbi:HAMP domain-containing protein [Actinoplanes sp. TBRC 11911]|uniref:methyl-accepting chemotaxis protein n=1 Tax=Actinoplanes sp. TBRC 11911 TaxID=2729386 RepID=UPI00145C9221|nr:methyl-accepting chemotaxis protein [Actinoplanes sp. TBRC 11911]NMO52731.1 HAMP domain-containing protein [Actinoplanes sp. TBRC 11911]
MTGIEDPHGVPWALHPMTAVCDRLRTGRRLAVLVLVLLIPGVLATTMYTQVRNDQIAFSTLEQRGADVVAPMLLALAGTVAGDTPDLEAVRTAVAAAPELGLGTDLPTDRLALAQALVQLITDAGNASNLILDPDLDSFYVMDAQVVQLPKALLAGVQAATAIASPGDRAVLAGTLSATAESLATDISTATRSTGRGDLARRLTPIDAVVTAAAALAAQIPKHTSSDPAALGAAARAAVAPLHEVLSDLLTARIGGFRTERLSVLAVAVGGFLLAGWFATAVVTRTTRDVRRTVAAVSALADGDFTAKPVPGGRDEMGDIGRALTAARTMLYDQDEELRGAQLAREEQLRSGFLHQRQIEAQFRERTQTVIDESTGVIADDIRRVTEKVGRVRDGAEVIGASIATTDTATTAVVEQARQAEQVITSLEQSLRRVAATAALVTGIAEQTRLLALNATIEAARAGELGEGFTVVADEVKQLATNTTRSTEQITDTIAALERDTANMAQTIATMIDGVNSVGAATDSLRAVVAEQDSLVDELSSEMTSTLDRVEQMSDLASRLERRQHERIGAQVPATLTIAGRPPLPATTQNLSAGGLRCTVQPGARIAEGDTVTVALGADDKRITVHATVVSKEGDDLGLQFIPPDAAAADVLRAFVSDIHGG